MKRIVTLIGIILLSCAGDTANAQYGSANEKVGGRDTLTDHVADTTLFAVDGAKANLTISFVIRKISGTLTGSVKWQYSTDEGATWYLAQTDTLLDESHTYNYEKNYNPGKQWRAIVTSIGTSVSSSEVWVLYRKQ